MLRRTFQVVISLALAGCVLTQPESKPAPPAATARATEAVPAPAGDEPAAARKAEQDFALGIKAYENGRYKEAQQSLRSALDGGLGSKADQVTANKTLAFIACSSRQQDTCKTYFRRALSIDPKFDLAPTEAGHPMWGAVFRSVKAERQKQ